jgi:hypothetical protein
MRRKSQRIEAAVSQDQHGPVRRDGWSQQTHHPQPFAAPGPFAASRQDGPGHWNADAAIHDIDGQYHETVAQRGRIDGEGQTGALPQADDPGQQGRETQGHLQALALGARFVGRIKAPFVQALFEVAHFAPQHQGQEGCYRQPATRPRMGNAKAPPGQEARLGHRQVRQIG